MTIRYPSLVMFGVYKAPGRPVGVEDVIECLLPGVRRLIFTTFIKVFITKSNSQVFHLVTLHMVSLKKETVTWPTHLNDCPSAFSLYDKNGGPGGTWVVDTQKPRV